MTAWTILYPILWTILWEILCPLVSVASGLIVLLCLDWLLPQYFNFNLCLEWLGYRQQCFHDSLKGLVKAILNYTIWGTRHSSPQLIMFPRIKNQSESERPSKAQKIQFLTLPLEIRFRIYEVLFATSVYHPFEVNDDTRGTHKGTTINSCPMPMLTSLSSHWPIVRVQHSERATSNSKLPLLLANKAIYAEARPFFYRYHTFRFECKVSIPSLHDGPRRNFYKLLGWMTKIELTNSKRHFPYENLAVSPRGQLRLLARSCPRLRSLRVDYHMSWQERPPPRLPELWARLVQVEIRFTTLWFREEDRALTSCLEAIAPMKDWREVGHRQLAGHHRWDPNRARAPDVGLTQHHFRLDRPAITAAGSQPKRMSPL